MGDFGDHLALLLWTAVVLGGGLVLQLVLELAG